MKTPSDDLWELIQSLSPSEKRYFKLYAQQSGNKTRNYMLLYDAVEGQATAYDEEAVKHTCEGADFLNQLSFTKNYLYNLILKSLESYHSESQPELRLRSMLSAAQLLQQRGLQGQSGKLLKKAEKLARGTHLLPGLLETLWAQSELPATAPPSLSSTQWAQGVAHSVALVGKHVALRLAAQQLQAHLATCPAQASTAPSPAIVSLLNEIEALAAQMQDNPGAQSLRLQAQAEYAECFGATPDSALAARKQFVGFLDANPRFAARQPSLWLGAHVRYARLLVESGHCQAPESIVALRKLPDSKWLAKAPVGLRPEALAQAALLELRWAHWARGPEAAAALACSLQVSAAEWRGHCQPETLAEAGFLIGAGLAQSGHFADAAQWFRWAYADAGHNTELRALSHVLGFLVSLESGKAALAEHKTGPTRHNPEHRNPRHPLPAVMLEHLQSHASLFASQKAAFYDGLRSRLLLPDVAARAQIVAGALNLPTWLAALAALARTQRP